MRASVFTGTCRARRAASQSGFSLIEMMISMTLSLIVMAGATSLFSATIGVNSAVIKSATLNQDVRTVVDFMLRDIRRHGYFSGDSLITVNQFDTQWQVNAAENCVFYAYDAKKDAVVDADDKMGFRLAQNGIQMRRNGAKCEENAYWENVTDPAMLKVTQFKVTKNPVFCTNITTLVHADCLGVNPIVGDIFVTTHDVTILMTAEVAYDPTINVTTEQRVRIKNDAVRVY